jgi:hypothetical protein
MKPGMSTDVQRAFSAQQGTSGIPEAKAQISTASQVQKPTWPAFGLNWFRAFLRFQPLGLDHVPGFLAL